MARQSPDSPTKSNLSENVSTLSLEDDDISIEDYLSDDEITNDIDPDVDADIAIGSHSSSLVPEVASQFIRIEQDKNRNMRHECRHCSKIVSGNNTRRLYAHIKVCRSVPKELKSNLKVIMREVVPNSKPDKVDLEWTEVLVAHGIPFNFSNSSKLKAFFNNNFTPRWNPPNPKRISSEYIPELARKLRSEMPKQISSSLDWSISVEFDHADLGSKSVLAIMLTFQSGKRYLLALEDSSVVGKSSATIIQQLEKCLKTVPKLKINSFVSDSAQACKKARDELCLKDDYRHVLSHRCIAHLLNLVIKRIKCDNDVSLLVNRAKAATELMSKRKDLQKLLQESGIKRVKQACETRWYTLTNMLCSLSAARSALIEIIDETDNGATLIYELVRDEAFWSEVDLLLDEVLVPLTYCIAQSERQDGSLGESFKCVLELLKKLNESDWNRNIIVLAFDALLHYFSEDKLGQDEYGLFLSSYYLDKRYKLDYIQDKGHDIVARTLRKLALKSGFSKQYVDSMLPEELADYIAQRNFCEPASEDEKASDWWSKQPNAGILRSIGMRMASIKSSSANVERTFSLIKAMMGLNRDNLSQDTLEDISALKVSSIPSVDDILHDRNEIGHEHAASSSQASTLSTNSFASLSSQNDARLSRLGSSRAREHFECFFEVFDFTIINSISQSEKRSLSDTSEDERDFISKAKSARMRRDQES